MGLIKNNNQNSNFNIERSKIKTVDLSSNIKFCGEKKGENSN